MSAAALIIRCDMAISLWPAGYYRTTWLHMKPQENDYFSVYDSIMHEGFFWFVFWPDLTLSSSVLSLNRSVSTLTSGTRNTVKRSHDNLQYINMEL